jgi:hypothetical protein
MTEFVAAAALVGIAYYIHRVVNRATQPIEQPDHDNETDGPQPNITAQPMPAPVVTELPQVINVVIPRRR